MQTIALKIFPLLIEKWRTENKTTGRSLSMAQNIAQYVHGTWEKNDLISKYISTAGNKIVIPYLEGQHVPPLLTFMYN
jgi:hypothetical protein